MRAKRLRGLGTAAVVVCALAGCAVGPDFVRAKFDGPEQYTADPLPSKTASIEVAGGAAQSFIAGARLPSRWWDSFGSDQLSQLIDQALRANPNIPAAEAALRVAQAGARAQRGSFFPQVGANLSTTRQRTPDILSPALTTNDSVYSLHTAQLSISYVPDVFGLNRRQVEALEAQVDFQRFQLAAAQLSITSNVVATAVQIASLRGQIEATRSTLSILQDQLGILRRQLDLGAIAEVNVIAQESTFAQTQALLPGLLKQLSQQQDLLAVLTGRPPAQMQALELNLRDLHLPEELPVTLPSTLAQRRPDILAAEAQLHTASAQVGVATANLYPQISLTAGLGSSAIRVADLFMSGTGLWSVAGAITQPLFQGGTLRYRRRAAEAAYEQALYQYRSTVLSALQNVADALHALRFDAEGLVAASTVERKAQQTLAIVQRQVELGDTSYLALLNAQQAYQQARLNAVQAQAARFTDTAALFQALGGGWTE